MTSRPSPPRRSNGSETVRAALLLTALLAAAPGARAASALVETSGGVTTDWAAGTLRATGGAAGDLRMPSVELAQPGAVRRAHAAAVSRLRAALEALPLGAGAHLASAEVERALGRARDVDVQYQSNGGAVVTAEVRFGDWLPELPDAAAAPVALSVAATHFGAAPPFKLGKREGRIGAALYAHGAAPRAANARAARVEHGGRLVVDGPAELDEKLARGRVLIYVEKVQR